jgi:8-oxo-dGTP pyrophosphatase MutT (NUDIX family)
VLPTYELSTLAALLARGSASPDAAAPAPKAAIGAILRAPPAGGDAEILLMRRAERSGDPWSGHMAFPGGRRDEKDASPLATAVREVREEVGIDLEAHGTLLARLPDVPATARGRRLDMIIAPFVFALRSSVELTPNHEVAETVWAPLGPLARGEAAGTFPYRHEGVLLHLPCLRVGERIVWGLTYQMLRALFDALHAA